MDKCKIVISRRDIFHLDYSCEKAYELGCKHVQKLTRTNASAFVSNDEIVTGIIDAAIEAGIAIPNYMSVVGFDDTRIARMARPRLTTVCVLMSSMGVFAVELLCQRIDDPKRLPVKVVLDQSSSFKTYVNVMSSIHQRIYFEG